MASVFLSALFALTPPESHAAPAAPSLDMSCYSLMAELAEDPDPRISAAALTGAQYFLGRLDGQEADIHSEAANPVAQREREQLVRQCGALMGAGGRDFRSLGERLARPRPTI